MGLAPGSHLETSLSLQRVTTLPKLLSRAKQYIESEDLLMAKKKCTIDYVPSSRHNRGQRFERKTYEEGEKSSRPREHTWKPRHDNKVFRTASEDNTRSKDYRANFNEKQQEAPNEYMRGCITLNTSREVLYDKFKRRSGFPEPKPLNPETKDSR